MKNLGFTLVFFFLLINTLAFAHGDEEHERAEHGSESHEKATKSPIPAWSLKLINQSYQKQVEPIFKKRCFDCHGSGNKKPWYASIPGPKQLIEWDIKTAKKHMDMSDGYPFKGHGSPKEDLEALIKVVQKDSMPPLRYLIMHPGGSLEEGEQKIIIDWAKASLAQLNQEPKFGFVWTF